MKIIYWFLVLLAYVVATSVTENSTSLTKERNNTITLLRTKRDDDNDTDIFSRVVIKDSFREIASEVEFQIRCALHGRGEDVNMKVINDYINYQFEDDSIFKHLIVRNPSWENYLLFSKGIWTSFYCTKYDFCSKYGNGYYGFGFCTPNICFCNFGVAEIIKCREGLVYNPVYRDCDVMRNVKVCGEN